MKNTTLFTMIALGILFCSSGILFASCSSPVSEPTSQGPIHPILHRDIQKDYDVLSCNMPVFCGNIVMLNCGAEVDGPLNYYDNTTGEVLMYCGGACMASDAQGKTPESAMHAHLRNGLASKRSIRNMWWI